MVLIECFHLQKEILLNRVQNMSQKIINQVVLIRFVGNTHVYQAPKSSCFIAAPAIGAHKALFNL